MTVACSPAHSSCLQLLCSACCVLIVMSIKFSCRLVVLTVCTNNAFSTSQSHQPEAPSACFAQHVMHAVATAIRGSARALVSSAACLLAVNISAACVLVTCAWPRSRTLCSNDFFEECIDVSCMHWHVTVLIVSLAVAPLAAWKLTLSRLCAVSVSPRTVMQASNATKQLSHVYCAPRSRSWHDGAFSTL